MDNMQNALYMMTQNSVIAIGKQASTIDLNTFISSINKAESIAPMLDPTLYRQAAENLAAVKKLAESLYSVQNAYNQLKDAVLRTREVSETGRV